MVVKASTKISSRNLSPVVAITGAGGFIGRHMMSELSRTGYAVVRVTKQHLEGKLRLPLSLRQARAVNWLHLAATFGTSPKYVMETNLRLTAQVLTLARTLATRQFIFTSSVTVLRKRQTQYSRSKKICETMISASGLPFTILRLSQVYGPGKENNFSLIIRGIKKWPIVFLPGNGKFRIQPLYVKDLAAVILFLLKNPRPDEILTLAGPQALQFKTIVCKIRRQLKRKTILLPISKVVFIYLLWLAKLLVPGIRMSPEESLSLFDDEVFSSSISWKAFGIKRTGFNEVIKQLTQGG